MAFGQKPAGADMQKKPQNKANSTASTPCSGVINKLRDAPRHESVGAGQFGCEVCGKALLTEIK
jgi:hypothetical protein